MPSTARLVDPTTGTQLAAFTAWTDSVGRLTSLDLGFPSVRASSVVISGGHGETDTTQWMGARAITAEVVMPAGSAADGAVDALAGLLNPRRRLWLYAQREGWTGERRALVRGASFACPPGKLRIAQAGWIAPGGMFEDATASSVTLTPIGNGTGGRTRPITFSSTFDPGLVPGASVVTVGGNVETPPVLDIYGPCSDPLVRCVDTGAQVAFKNLTLADGDYLHVDLDARTATLNGDPTLSKYNLLDLTTSTWWTLPVGSPEVVFSPSLPGPGCGATVTWRNRWL